MKKIIPLLLALLGTAACGSEPQPASTSTPSEPKQMATPLNLTASVRTATELTFTWSPVKGADRYLWTLSEGQEVMAKASTAETTATIRNLTPTTEYLFSVQAYGDAPEMSKPATLTVTTRDDVTALYVIETTLGNMTIRLYDETPLHKAHFSDLFDSGFYTGVQFDRVSPNFMIQAGYLEGYTSHYQTWQSKVDLVTTVPAEISFDHKRGAVASARQGDDTNPLRASSALSFYIAHTDTGCRHLNGQYTVWGEIVDEEGFATLDAIANTPRTSNNYSPEEPVVIQSIHHPGE